MAKIPASDLVDMTTHWLSTPLNGYLGSSYGQIVTDMLQKPLASGLADATVAKLRADVPLLAALPPGSVNLYSVDDGPDKRNLFIEVAGEFVPVGGDN
ncbi:hypothetical protein [Burkholderia ubonensis]|uniref:Uncharacterized protein n=1 Tax=Burkholderia ubonensis TaxID=101571 RepID=A0ABD4E159_9BURK|nr:hypothetical protein [Burkholderia ubonensis]KVN83425.1 hypothetical protein WJ68_16040 [Burkholderia ubonensis]